MQSNGHTNQESSTSSEKASDSDEISPSSISFHVENGHLPDLTWQMVTGPACIVPFDGQQDSPGGLPTGSYRSSNPGRTPARTSEPVDYGQYQDGQTAESYSLGVGGGAGAGGVLQEAQYGPFWFEYGPSSPRSRGVAIPEEHPHSLDALSATLLRANTHQDAAPFTIGVSDHLPDVTMRQPYPGNTSSPSSHLNSGTPQVTSSSQSGIASSDRSKVPIPRLTSGWSTSSMNSSKSSSSSTKRFSCHLCPETCGRKDDLQRHIRKHPGEAQYNNVCDTCGYKRVRKDKVQDHQKNTKHSGITVVNARSDAES